MFLAVRFSHAGWGLLLGLTCCATLPAFADTDSHLLTRATLTGDWGGLRHQMDQDGIKLTGEYSGETAYNADGGLHRSARYSQNIKLGAQFDLSKLYGVDNAGKI
jgi:porin